MSLNCIIYKFVLYRTGLSKQQPAACGWSCIFICYDTFKWIKFEITRQTTQYSQLIYGSLNGFKNKLRLFKTSLEKKFLFPSCKEYLLYQNGKFQRMQLYWAPEVYWRGNVLICAAFRRFQRIRERFVYFYASNNNSNRKR